MTTRSIHRPPGNSVGDDCVVPFATAGTGVSGRLVRLGVAVDDVLVKHAYPEPVSVALGEALVLVALLGSALKIDGQLILQTKTDGPLGLLVADYMTPGRLRGYANAPAAAVEGVTEGGRARDLQARLLGTGHLAMTIDPGGDMERYQGIVALDGMTLVEAAHTYFRQSEQLPTLIRVAVAREFTGGAWRWRAGGLMIQKVARGGGHRPTYASDEARDAALDGEDDEDWRRLELLAATVEDHELIDPTLDPHRLLYRLFHEEGVSASEPVPLIAKCRCERDRLLGYLKGFDAGALADLRDEDGRLRATCEFCSTVYTYGPDDGIG